MSPTCRHHIDGRRKDRGMPGLFNISEISPVALARLVVTRTKERSELGVLLLSAVAYR